MTKRSGIPDELTIETAREWMKPRVTERRFKHVRGVAAVAREIAEKTDCDPFVAELGGWLHDACKEIKDKELVVQAKQFGLQLHPIEEVNGHLLHGPVGALTAKRDLGVTDQILLDAIGEHTLGAVDMTPLSQILFLADCLEESRDDEFTVPIWKALGYKVSDKVNARKFSGQLDLDAAILVACDLSLQYLLDDKKVIHPKTVAVRNFYLDKIKSRTGAAKS
jgi:predicted HD superfamily hydrolase involved in NAD metabolism